MKFICVGGISKPRDGDTTEDEGPVENEGSELGSELG